jgi:energy-converting hydrogenase Eha subunit E
LKNQYKRQVLFLAGVALVVIGLIFVAVGLDGLRTPIPCAINGCPSIFSETYAVYWDEIYIGTAMVVLGIGLIVASRMVKVDSV